MKGFLKSKQLEVLLSLGLTLIGAVASMIQQGQISLHDPVANAIVLIGLVFLARAGASHLQGTDVSVPAAPVVDVQSEEDTLIAAAEAFLAKRAKTQQAVDTLAMVTGAIAAPIVPQSAPTPSARSASPQ